MNKSLVFVIALLLLPFAHAAVVFSDDFGTNTSTSYTFSNFTWNTNNLSTSFIFPDDQQPWTGYAMLKETTYNYTNGDRVYFNVTFTDHQDHGGNFQFGELILKGNADGTSGYMMKCVGFFMWENRNIEAVSGGDNPIGGGTLGCSYDYPYTILLQYNGSHLNAKMYSAGTAEPVNWTFSNAYTTPTSDPSGGAIGVLVHGDYGNSYGYDPGVQSFDANVSMILILSASPPAALAPPSATTRYVTAANAIGVLLALALVVGLGLSVAKFDEQKRKLVVGVIIALVALVVLSLLFI